VVLVVSNKATAGALERARKADVPTAVLQDPADPAELVTLLREHDVDLVVLAGYLKLVPEEVVQAFEDRMINIHPALLPSFGGPGMYGHHVHEAVLESGATVSGPGPIIAQWPVPVAADDTPESLAARVLGVEHQLLPAVVLAAARAGGVVRLVGRAASFGPSAEAGGVADALIPN
jgi:folate-dependent phosphoribosylglycinamide formyltransferase PurN